MCMLSLVMDQYKPYVPRPNDIGHQPGPFSPRPIPNPVVDPVALRQLLDAFHQAVAAAKTFDKVTGQPDCVDPEKAKLEERVAELERRLDAMAAAATAPAEDQS